MSVYKEGGIVEFNVHIHVRVHVSVWGGLARLASLGSLGARVYCGVHGDFLNQFRKSRDVYGV